MKIVAFLDRSLYAHSVVDHAGWLAQASGASVDLVQIVSPSELIAAAMPPIHPGGPVMLRADRTLDDGIAALHEHADAQLEQGRAKLVESGIENVGTSLLEGDVARHLADTAADATIVVIGKRGEHADLARLPLGSNFERLLRDTRTPVLAVSRLFRPVDRMLLAMGLGPGSAHAIDTLAVGILPPAPVRLLHVGAASEAVLVELDRAAARLSAAGYAPATEVAEGIARFAIPDRVVADEIGLVAMGTSSGSPWKSLIFGSLASELIRACQVPILLCQ